ncbi:DUF2147 domain-containing protein [Rhodopseudomonas sp. P2A-2r]|uniref:DUF2147 domain-containing protein n=1 Tax=Rhodopseudomonas sp. P2A-2r TaxID=2991972 RepID=UPI0022344D73|nr:DUF2147 domain-containing protein [Rhodopseudomonas sp. P2A-2r]UZE47029.1 DUF2147 domain-containing protein [Rhodopseudomonas sp. P2A-2r]
MKRLVTLATLLLAGTAAQATDVSIANSTDCRNTPCPATAIPARTPSPAKHSAAAPAAVQVKPHAANAAKSADKVTKLSAVPASVAAARAEMPVAKPATPAVTNPAVVASLQKQQPVAPRPPSSPLGVWLTEEKEGKVRIEPCGTNLCGYSVNTQTDANADQVLINMKPVSDIKWSGRIFDPNSGSTYDSTIALKSPDSLRVQGCAFGGMFCGGQTWSRVN